MTVRKSMTVFIIIMMIAGWISDATREAWWICVGYLFCMLKFQADLALAPWVKKQPWFIALTDCLGFIIFRLTKP